MPIQWDDDNRPPGTPNPDVAGEIWDAEARAWSASGLTPEPVPLFDHEMIEIEAQFRAAVERDMQYPLLLARDESFDTQLVSFAYHNKSRLTMLRTAIVGLMQTRWEARTADSNCAYSAAVRNEFRFNDWVQRAGEIRRARDADLRRLQHQAAHAERIERRDSQRYNDSPRIEGENNLTPEQQIEHDSVYMRAIGHLRHKRHGRIWYDEFLHDVMTDWACDASSAVVAVRSVTDLDELALMEWLIGVDPHLSNISKRTVGHVIGRVASLNKRHVVREWIASLPGWDQDEQLGVLMSTGFSTEYNEYTKAVGTNWLVSMVARVMQPGCQVDTMPVFYGAQGEAKTSALRIIAAPWYGDVTERADSKDFLMRMRGKWLLEIGEMHAIAASRVEQAHVKAMLTRLVDEFRPPYAAVVQKYPRQMVFAGTTNVDDWHTDPTGGRRYNPVKCLGTINLEWIRLNRDQLFAEALHRQISGHAWWLVPEGGHREALEAQQSVGAFDNIINDWLEHLGAAGTLYSGPGHAPPAIGPDALGRTPEDLWGNVVTTERVIVQWLGMGLSEVPRHQVAVGTALRRLGWTRDKRRFAGIECRHWVRISPTVVDGELPL